MLEELITAVARHALADDLGTGDIEGGKQSRRAVTFVIVRQCGSPSALEGYPGWVRSGA